MWGLFDHDLYVDYNGEHTGPYYPVSGPIPLNRYRSFKKTRADETADRLHQLAAQLGLLMAALTGETDVRLVEPAAPIAVPRQPFDAAAGEYQYPTAIAAKLAMADIAYDVLLETGVLIQPLPVWEDEWEHPESYTYPALLQNINREGVRL